MPFGTRVVGQPGVLSAIFRPLSFGRFAYAPPQDAAEVDDGAVAWCIIALQPGVDVSESREGSPFNVVGLLNFESSEFIA